MFGCQSLKALNFDSLATATCGSTFETELGPLLQAMYGTQLTQPTQAYIEANGPGSRSENDCCEWKIQGCMDSRATNYIEIANAPLDQSFLIENNQLPPTYQSDGCFLPSKGCMDPAAINFNPTANFNEEGSCLYLDVNNQFVVEAWNENGEQPCLDCSYYGQSDNPYTPVPVGPDIPVELGSGAVSPSSPPPSPTAPPPDLSGCPINSAFGKPDESISTTQMLADCNRSDIDAASGVPSWFTDYCETPPVFNSSYCVFPRLGCNIAEGMSNYDPYASSCDPDDLTDTSCCIMEKVGCTLTLTPITLTLTPTLTLTRWAAPTRWPRRTTRRRPATPSRATSSGHCAASRP